MVFHTDGRTDTQTHRRFAPPSLGQQPMNFYSSAALLSRLPGTPGRKADAPRTRQPGLPREGEARKKPRKKVGRMNGFQAVAGKKKPRPASEPDGTEGAEQQQWQQDAANINYAVGMG
eukprot:gene9965-biopygen8929